MSMRDEILEQPDVARRLLRSARPALAELTAVVRQHGIDYVMIAGRGTSDHAAIYAQYLLGARNRLAVALAAPSILSLYKVAPRVERALVIGISQSGASPDIVGVVEAGRAQGAPTLAITNTPDSALARAADHVIDLGAGPERSVAATKTYTAELVAVAMLSAALLEGAERTEVEDLESLPEAMEEALAAEPEVRRIADAAAGMEHCMVLGRGFEYATAREWALKLKELSGVMADPYSTADFEHGPKALVEPGFPVLAVAPSGAGAVELRELLTRLRAEHGARLLVLSDDPETRALADDSIPLPPGTAPWLSPIVSIVPAQLHAYYQTIANGRDPASPRYIRKVTLTR
jgi:glucosamine--fructose-6-phosphate aminotransferase (isomerizing)